MKQLTFGVQAEQSVRIPLPGTSVHVSGILRGTWSQPVVIMLHGLPGANHSLLEFLGAKYLAEQGYATFRINLYDSTPGTRNLIDCTLQTHADDFDAIVQYVQAQGAPCVLATGHSYGGLTILRSTAILDGAVLWDPSHFRCSAIMDVQQDANSYIDALQADMRLYIDGKGALCPISMIEERRQHRDAKPTWSSKPYPVLFVAAGKGILVPYIQEYMQLASPSADYMVIEDATHCFRDSDEVLFELLEATERWLATCQQPKK